MLNRWPSLSEAIIATGVVPVDVEKGGAALLALSR
jgi:hypothetical protein